MSGELEECYLPTGFTIHQGRAYASCGTGVGINDGVKIFDLRQDPPFPWLVMGPDGSTDPGLYSSAMAIVGASLWVSDEAGRLRGFDVGACADFPSMLALGQLTLVGEVGRVAWDAARGRLLAVAGDGLTPIDVADADAPVAGPALTGGIHIGQIDPDGDRLAMVSGWSGDAPTADLELRDLRDPAAARLIVRRSLPDFQLSYWTRSPLSLDGGRLLMALFPEQPDNGFGLRDDRLSLWDIPADRPPAETKTWPVSGHILALDLLDDRVVVITDLHAFQPQDRFGLSILDLGTGARRDLEFPLPAADDFDVDVRLAGDWVWLALSPASREKGTGSVQLMRAALQDPSGVRLETVWQEPIGHGYASSVKLVGTRSGDTLFLAHSGGHVHGFAPALDGIEQIVDLGGTGAADIAITPDGDRVFLAMGAGGLVEFRRPPDGWASFPTPLPTAARTVSPTPAPKGTMVVRARRWLPRLGAPVP